MNKVDIRDQVILLLVSNRKKGVTYDDCIPLLKENFPKLTDSLIADYIREAKTTLKKEFELEREFLIDIHTLRYEELYDAAINAKFDHLPLHFKEQALTTSHMNALDILTQKEKMLGLHSKKFKIQVNNYLQSKGLKQFKGFDFSSISLEERIELLQLIELTRDKEEVLRPITKQDNSEVKVVKQIINRIEAPIQQSRQTDVIGKGEEEEKKPEGRNLIQIQTSIQKKIQEQLETALKKQKK